MSALLPPQKPDMVIMPIRICALPSCVKDELLEAAEVLQRVRVSRLFTTVARRKRQGAGGTSRPGSRW